MRILKLVLNARYSFHSLMQTFRTAQGFQRYQMLFAGPSVPLRVSSGTKCSPKGLFALI